MKTIKLRKISRGQAEKEIKEYFEKHHGKDLDVAMIQEALGIEVWDVIEILSILEAKGEIEHSFSTGRIYKLKNSEKTECHSDFCNDKAVYICPVCKRLFCEWHHNYHEGRCCDCEPPELMKIERGEE